MTTTTLDCRGFACPLVPLDPSLLEFLVVDHARQTVRAFLDRHEDRLRRGGDGVEAMLASWLSDDDDFGLVWDPAFGGIFAALLRADDEIEQRACALALRLHERGHAGDWELRLPGPARLRFDRWLLPPADALRVSAAPDAVRIRARHSGDWRDAAFDRGGGAWHGDGEGVDALPVISRAGVRLIVLSPEAPKTWEFEDLCRTMDAGSPEPLVPSCGAALGILADHADTYFRWVRSVLRFVIPWKTVPGELPSGSGSQSCAPGVVGIGNLDHPLAIADSLVHESSHQYFYIMLRLGPVDDGSDSELYFNPFLDMKRPIDRILLAYHAFANVLLFCRAARADGLRDDPYLTSRERQLGPLLAVLEEALRTTRALTPLGRALWEPLYERVHAD